MVVFKLSGKKRQAEFRVAKFRDFKKTPTVLEDRNLFNDILKEYFTFNQ